MSVFYLPEHKCVFIPIPKTGGTSIRKGFFDGNYIGPEFKMPSNWMQYDSFAFVRNPSNRLISCWKMFTAGTSERPPSKYQGMTSSRFLDFVTDDSIPYTLGSDYNWQEHARHHALPQTHSYNQLDKANFIGRYENLETDWIKVCRSLNLEPRALPVRHFTKRDSYPVYYSSMDRARAEAFYAKDLEALDYAF